MRPSRSPALLSALATLLLGLASCSRAPEPPAQELSPPSATPPPASARAASSASPPLPSTAAQKGELRWDAPAAWTKAESPSAFRKATYKVPHAPADSEDGELSVSQVGGSLDANIARWTGQFEGSPKETRRERTVGDLHVTLVEIHGTFSGGGMPGAPPAAPKKDYTLLAAIVDTEPRHFFKLTAPAKTATLATADFDKLVGSFRIAP